MSADQEGEGERPHVRPLSLRDAEPSDRGEVSKAPVNWRAALRFAGFLTLIVGALMFVDTSQIKDHLARMSWDTLALMTGLHVLIILLTAWRFSHIAHVAGATISTLAANRLTFASTLANLLLPTSLAGDAGRVVLVRRYGLSLKAALAVGVFDRVIGLASLGAVVLFGTLIAPALLPLWGGAAIIGACLALTGFILIRSRNSGGIFAGSRSQIARVMLVTVALSIAAHSVSVLIAFAFLQDQPVNVGIGALSILFPVVLLAASIPVSVGGWGTREIAAAGAFGTIGVEPSIAIAMAFMFGVTQTFAAGLGTVILALYGMLQAKADRTNV